jgi:ferredoxin
MRNPFAHDARADVLLRLADEYGRREVVPEHPRSPVGLVEINRDACTACGMCARSCPTEALTFTETQEGVSLSFDPARCVACAQCLPRCPEAEREAICLRSVVDLEAIAGGRVLVYTEETARCIACGSPIAPVKMMRRLEEILGDEYAQVMPVLNQYCMDCRVMAQG